MSIRKKIVSSFMASAGLVVVVSITAYLSLNKIADNIKTIRHHSDEIERAADLQLLLERVIMPVNDWVITGKEKYKADFKRLAEETEEKIKEIESFRLTDEDKKLVEEVRRNFDAIKDFADQIINMPVANINKAAGSLMEVMDYEYTYPLVGKVEQLHAVARGHMNAAADRAGAIKITLNLLMAVVSVLSIAIVFLLNIIIVQRVANPLDRLTAVTGKIADGDLSQRAEVKSDDELGQLSGAFNRMIDEIQKRNEELQTMNEELRSTNEELETSNEELQATTEELEASNEELRTAQEELVQKEKLAAVGQLASGVGHELRNPLGVIKNAAYYIKSKLGAADPKLAKHLDIMEREINNSNKIISDLLNFSRTRQPELIPADINAVIEEAVAVASIPENIRVNRNLTSGLPKPAIDSDQIRQVFLNLILNACQAMPAGGALKISSSRHKGGLIVAGKEKDYVGIEFTDTGTGIPPENLKKIFDPFFTTKARGIGLGLAVSKGIIENLAGDIAVKSELNKGTTFIVKLGI